MNQKSLLQVQIRCKSVPGESDDLGEKPEDGNKSVKKAAPPKTKTISASTEFNDKDLEELEEKEKNVHERNGR